MHDAPSWERALAVTRTETRRRENGDSPPRERRRAVVTPTRPRTLLAVGLVVAVLANLVVDVLYSFIDPRVRLS